MITAFVRTIILYFLIVVGMRLMGKRQIGELEPSELVLTMMISDLAAVPMQDFGIPLLSGLLPILTLLALSLLLSQLSLRSLRLRALICGTPTVLIRGGKLQQDAMRKNRFTIDELMEELREQGVTYSDTMELGIMIETPAAAIISDRLAPMVDFFSVGTNDLTQYTLACDRQNPDIEPFIDTHHEAILRLIEMSAKNAHANGAWIGICGELAADTTLTETFLRMGIDELSVSPAFVLKVRDAVRNVDLRK